MLKTRGAKSFVGRIASHFGSVVATCSREPIGNQFCKSPPLKLLQRWRRVLSPDVIKLSVIPPFKFTRFPILPDNPKLLAQLEILRNFRRHISHQSPVNLRTDGKKFRHFELAILHTFLYTFNTRFVLISITQKYIASR